MIRISSWLTWYFQYVLLVGWALIFGSIGLGILFGKFSEPDNKTGADDLNQILIPYILVSTLGALIFGFLFLRLRRVYYDDQYLYLHSAFGKVSIPHSDVLSFQPIRFISPQFYVIHYKINDMIHSPLCIPRFPFFRAFFGNKSVEKYESFRNGLEKR